jgi:hypothetical protein
LSISEAAVVAILLRRGGWRTLPLFCTYLAWGSLSDATLFIILGWHPALYYKYYLLETIVDSLLMFSVLVELAWSVLRPVRASLPKATVWVLAVLVGLAGLCIWPIAGMTVPPIKPENQLLFHIQETFSILRVVCFVVLASLSQILSIGWRDRELQVATGLGFYSIIGLLVTLLHSHQGDLTAYHWLDEAGVSLGYLGTLVYWVISFSTQEQERKEFSPQMRDLLLQMGGGARGSRIALTDLPSVRSKTKE